MLTSLEIKNFRAFSHLVIPRLGRVNLIVGKNNVGKTTLLEALRICGSTSLPKTIHSILNDRNEVRASSDLTPSGEPKRYFEIPTLWHGLNDNVGNRDLQIVVSDETPEISEVRFQYSLTINSEAPALVAHLPNGTICSMDRDGSSRFKGTVPEQWLDIPVDAPFLTSNVNAEEADDMIGAWWDATWMSGARERVLELVRSIAPIYDAIFVRDPRHKNGRMARVRIEGFKDSVSLASSGDGVARLFHIALAMEFARYRSSLVRDLCVAHDKSFSPGSQSLYSHLLIDEVDTGIHHSMHADLWKFIFRAARQLDVQLFATTHSLDCLRGFAEAAAEDQDANAQVIRLERDPDEEATRAIVIGQEKLPYVVRDSIEVR